MSLHIPLSNTTVKFHKFHCSPYDYYRIDGAIYIDVEGETEEGISFDDYKEISKETLKSYIDKLQELYDSV